MQCCVIGGFHGDTDCDIFQAQLNGQNHDTQTPSPVQSGSSGENMPEEQPAGASASITTKIRLMMSIFRHDTLNRISVIHGYNDLLSDRLPKDPEFRRNYAKMMKMVDCIEKQVEFIAYYLSTCSPDQDWYSLGTIIQDTLSGYTLTDVRVSVDVGNAEIFTDLLVTRVFANLIENAVRHGGSITEIRITFSESKEYGVIAIEDDGIGVPPAEKSRIFSPGYGHNTGMGLYLARMILGIIGFSIQETGHEGHGARFEIRIPPDHYRIGN